MKLDQFIAEWNYKFPLDRWWRQKYQVPLFSPRHLETSQIDILFEYLETQLFERYQEKAELINKKNKEYEKGNIITFESGLSDNDEMLWDKMGNFSLFDKKEDNTKLEFE